MNATINSNGKSIVIELTQAQIEAVKRASTDVTERIKSYEDACHELGLSPLKQSDFGFLPQKDQEYHFEDHKQVVIIRALNEGWEPNYADTDEEKWYIWYKWVGSGAGFVFDCSYFALSHSFVGARHEFRSQKLAEYFAKQFIGTVNKRFIIKKAA